MNNLYVGEGDIRVIAELNGSSRKKKSRSVFNTVIDRLNCKV